MYNNSWIGFQKEIDKSIEDLKFQANEETFYRGHSKYGYKLTPGLLRNISLYKKKYISDSLWDKEADIFYEFRSRARELHSGELTDWDILFYMQHHGVRTRLLDWTESFAVALYFAIYDSLNINNIEPCVWIFNPYAWNEKFHGSRDLWDPENLEEDYSKSLLGDYKEYEGEMFYWNQPRVLYPLRKSNRLTNQSGYFTIHGNDCRAIEEIDSKSIMLKKVILPQDAIPEAQKFLNRVGINQFTLFPDLDGLAKYLNSKYLI